MSTLHGICPHHHREVEERMAGLREEIQREAQRREEEERRTREQAERAGVEELRRRGGSVAPAGANCFARCSESSRGNGCESLS